MGDEAGSVGVGVGSSKEVVGAVQKAVTKAKKTLITVPLNENSSFPHRIDGIFGAAKVRGCLPATARRLRLQRQVAPSARVCAPSPTPHGSPHPPRSHCARRAHAAPAALCQVMLRPASEGTGVIAGGSVRVVLELAGVKNAFGKQLGTQNTMNNAKATIQGLQSMRTVEQVAELRGVPVETLYG